MANDEYEEKSGQIRQLAAMSPDQFTDHLAALHPHIDQVAPNIAPHVFSTAANSVAFLNSKLPHRGDELLQNRAIEPSEAQKNAWLDLHAVINDPISVLDKVKDFTLNRHHLEIMQSIYPDLHQEMASKMREELGALKMSGGSLPYEKKLMMSKFLGEPIDATFNNQNMQAIIHSASLNTGPEAQASQRGHSKTSGSALTQINKVNQLYQTPLQALQRKELKP